MKKLLLSIILVLSLCSISLAQPVTGTFEVLQFDKMKLHIFTTTQGPGDVSYVFETSDSLVLFELPSINHLSRQLKDYVDNLNKPVQAILVGYHVGGASYYPNVPIYASKYAINFIDSGEEMKVRKAIAATTADFDLNVIKPDNIVAPGKQTIAGIDFIFIEPTTSPIPGMNVVIPAIDAYYQHVLGGSSHPILLSMEHIDKVIAELKNQQQANYALMLDSHNGLEKPSAITKKIAYLEKLKNIRQSSSNQEEFVNAVKSAFPDYKGERALISTAKNLYR